MSAFVISTKTMDRAVTALLSTHPKYASRIIQVFDDVDTASNDAGTTIGRRLFGMNIEAVQQRYPDTIDNPDDMPGTAAAAYLDSAYQYAGRAGLRASCSLMGTRRSSACATSAAKETSSRPACLPNSTLP